MEAPATVLTENESTAIHHGHYPLNEIDWQPDMAYHP